MAIVPSVDFVRLELSKSKRIKLRFKHSQLRKAVIASGGRAIGDLVGDPFGGWPYLLAEGHRPYTPTVTLDQASEWMDEWVETPNPKTGEQRTLDELGSVILDGLKASKFIVLKPDVKEGEDKDLEETSEGNAPPEASTPTDQSRTSGVGSLDS